MLWLDSGWSSDNLAQLTLHFCKSACVRDYPPACFACYKGKMRRKCSMLSDIYTQNQIFQGHFNMAKNFGVHRAIVLSAYSARLAILSGIVLQLES